MAAEVAHPSFAELSAELPWRSPRAWRFAGLGVAGRAAALVSEGHRIGYREGFDSGAFMAHVYDDTPRGRTALGRALDRRLLARPTLEAFRDIRDLAREAVVAAIDAHEGPEPAVVADLAAGPSPYLVEAITDRPGVRAVIRDVDANALATAGGAAARAGVAERVVLERADVFDREALARTSPRPDIVLELGLYGMYHDDGLIERHFADLAETLAPRQIVFNVQTQNPEIEYIARVWVNRDGERCVWRLRPVEQILGYAAAVGYATATITADRHGIYRVVRLVRDAT